MKLQLRPSWLIAMLASLAQNVAYGLTFGLYGTVFVPVAAEFHASNAVIASGMSVIGLVHGLLSPAVGALATRWSVRRLMMSGAAALGLTFAACSLASSAWSFVALYGVLGGAAVATMGLTPVTILISQWFKENRGKAFGLVMLPWLPMIAPLLGALAIEHLGWRAMLRAAALVCFGACALFTLVRSPDKAPSPPASSVARSSWFAAGGFKPDRFYWTVTIIASTYSGTTVILLTHVPAFATGQGITLAAAATLVSVQGLCGMLGAPLFGALLDRLRAAHTFAVVALLVMSSAALLAFTPSYALMVMAACLAGLAGGATTPVLGAVLAARCPPEALGPAVGLAGLVMLPFIGVLPTLAGYLVDATAGYQIVFLLQIALALCAGVASLLALRPGAPIPAHRDASLGA